MNASDDRPKSSRVEREVLEILERADAAQSPVDNLQFAARRRAASARTQAFQASRGMRLSARRPPAIVRLGAALILAVIAALIGDTLHWLAVILAIASGVAFFSLWAPMGPSAPGGAPRWRGQDLQGDGPSRFFDDRPGRWPKLPRR
jgi:hypothetical protein